MFDYECPLNLNKEQCRFINRRGSVRDAPETGVKECQECSLVIHDESLRQLVNYESGSMHSWSSGYGLRGKLPSDDSTRRLESVIDLAKTEKIENILDFGSGEGLMLSEFARFFSVYGFEPETKAREFSVNSGFEVFSNFKHLQTKSLKFDLITLFHVIEHLYEPNNLLVELKNYLRPGGLIIIETPNSMDALLTFFECESFQNFTYWSHHPMLYSPKALSHLVSRSMYELVENKCIQRYSLANHLYWLSKGRPGGHDIWESELSKEVSQEYAKVLVEKEISDTLWLVARNSEIFNKDSG